MSNKVKDISTESLRISTEDLLKTIFYNLDAAELQELYDWTGSDARKLRNNLKLKISTKKFAAKLSDSGVMLSPVDMGRARIDTIELVERSVARFTLGDEFDPAELMDDAAEAKLDPTVFNKMDFREIPRPKNILDWITGREFLNAMPFPRQLQVMLHFLEEYCPYCSDNDFLKDIHLSPYLGEDGIHQRPWTIQEIQERVQLTEYGICPKCKSTYHDMLFDPMVPHKAPNELAMVCGQRSGKTRMSEMIMTYLNCRFQLLSPSPQQHFGEDMTQQLTSMFTALDLSQSADTLWGNYHIRIETAPWYKKYHSWLDYHGKKAGIEMYRIKDTYHSWAPTLLQDRLKPPFAKSMRGRTGYMMGIDEIGMFARGENAVRANADEVYQAMSNTLFTIRTDADALNRKRILTPTAPMVCVSSPWELLDKIMRLVRDAPKSPRRVAFHFATWEMNPKIYRDSDQVKAEFIDDEVKALRDWGAIPPLAENPFHTNMNAIDALPAKHRPCFVQSIKTSKTKSGNHFVYAVPTQMTPDKSTPRIMTIDSGETNNSFALTMWSVIKAASPIVTGADEEDAYAYEDEDEDIQVILDTMRELKEKEPEKEATKGMSTYLRNDGTIEVIPFKENNVALHKVHYKKMYDLCIIPIVKAFNIIAVVADRWNMASIFHGLAEEGIMCHHYTLTWNDFKAFKKKTNDRELLLLPLEKPYEKVFEDYDEAIKDAPNLHLIVQMKTVRKVGRQVVKPKGGTDDLYRTTVLAHRFAMNDNPKDVAVNHLGIPYLTIMETSGVGERQSRGMGVVLMRRDVVRHRVHGDTQISGIGGYTSARNHISRKKQRGSY